MKQKNSVSIVFVIGLLMPSLASAAMGGKAIIVKGNPIKTFDGKTTKLTEGAFIEEGAMITTSAAGAVKILMSDQTQISVGPSSRMKLDPLSGSVGGAITVLKGQIRAKVIKDLYANVAIKRVKMVIRTRSATMGVRGTDFQTVYNPENNVTSVVTFEGEVAMVKTDPANAPKDLGTVTELLSGDKAVAITEGKMSNISAAVPEVTLPVKISPSQFETLKSADPTSLVTAGANDEKAGRVFVSPIPPGMDAKTFTSSGAGLEKQLVDNGAKPPTEGGPALASVAPPGPPPEGFYDKKTGAYAPPAGGFIDLKTGLYVSPPPGSAFDANAGVFIPPPTFGKFDPNTGGYVPPTGFQLDPTKGFIAAVSPGGMPVVSVNPVGGPASPMGPALPGGPASPMGPVLPGDPASPMGPALPGDPIDPMGPALPVGDCAPFCGTVGPDPTNMVPPVTPEMMNNKVTFSITVQ